MASPRTTGAVVVSVEGRFGATFATRLALKEKQIQQNYRPIIGVHKWFARRPGTIFRCLLLAEFNGNERLEESYWKAHRFKGRIADPFMGGGTPIFEANRLGFHVLGTDINPMAFWVVRQSLGDLDLEEFARTAEGVIADVEVEIGRLYETQCLGCGKTAKVKYFLWVKTAACPACRASNDLFPGYLLAEDERHPRNVVACAQCGHLNEYSKVPTAKCPAECAACGEPVHVEGNVRRHRLSCRNCKQPFSLVQDHLGHPPRHRLWSLEYHCVFCKPGHDGRFFKKPDAQDLRQVVEAERLLVSAEGLPIPEEEIPRGDETDRLHRWGYRRYREMFNQRQLLGLGTLLRRIMRVKAASVRHALLTVFSDSLRYQNMLCRYDTYALKCQDIFSVHGFPVGLVQCENNLLGIPRVGSGSFGHFVEKYLRAKRYCQEPFEILQNGKTKKTVQVKGERISARLVSTLPKGKTPQALLCAVPAVMLPLRKGTLDGVFTDPPYFDNVQYAELMDFCFAWLRLGLRGEFKEFEGTTTRSAHELTGNETLGRGIAHFTEGLSKVFQHYAGALKPGAPFVFTYHHNDAGAYLPLVVAILDAGLDCTATLPAAAEMSASLHILGTGSSVLDSVFVCRPLAQRDGKTRQSRLPLGLAREFQNALFSDAAAMRAAGLEISKGDLKCLSAGHIARLAVNSLTPSWEPAMALQSRMERGRRALTKIEKLVNSRGVLENALDQDQPGSAVEGESNVTSI
jgi:adenine-specific DNA methylase